MENQINAETSGTVQGDPRRGRRLRRHRRRARRHRVTPASRCVAGELRTLTTHRGHDASADLRRRRVHRRAVPRESRRRSCSAHGDEAWMQRVAAEMRHSETAFVARARRRRVRPALVHARGRGRPLRPRDARERARALRDRSGVAPTRRSVSTRAAASSAPTHAGAARHHARLPRRRPGCRDPIPELFAALGLADRPSSCAPTATSSCASSTTPTTVRDARARLRRAAAVSRRARRVRHRAGDDGGYDIVSRCFAPRVGIDEDPGHRIDALRARRVLGRRGSAATSCARTRRRRAAARSPSLRKGDRALLTGPTSVDGARAASYAAA